MLSPDDRRLQASLQTTGIAHRSGVSQAELVDILEALGRPIYVEEVRPTPASSSLVRSRRGISWHTDHHRAERIVWYCLQQSDRGGETLLVDAREAYELLDARDRELLREVRLFEHSVFTGDDPVHPMVTLTPSGPRFYYSLWLANEDMDPEQRRAFDAFGAAIERCHQHRLLLQPGDVLAIDNGRILHARTAIEGDAPRHLRRYWLAT